MWGTSPSASHLLDLVRDRGGVSDPIVRQRFARLYTEVEVLRLGRLRTLSARLKGQTPGVEASIQKIMGDEHGQHVMELANVVAGTAGMIAGSGPQGALPPAVQTVATEVNFPRGEGEYRDVDPIWHYGFLYAPALTVGGGAFAVQRNIIAEQVLGLSRDINVEQGKTWAESRRQRS